MKRFIVLTLLLTLCSPPALASAYEDGVAQYNKHSYAEAARLLYAATMSEHSNDAVAHYYLANTLLQMRHNDAAKAEYASALKLSPTGAVANYCRTALKTLSTTSSTTPVSDEPAVGTIGVTIDFSSGRIQQVHADTPAARAGLHTDDLITAVNGTALEDLEDPAEAIRGDVGSTVTLTIKRAGITKDYALTRTAATNNAFKMALNRQLASEKANAIQAIPNSDKPANVDDMVEVVKATDMHPELTADFIASVKAALSRMPSGILQTLRSSSCRVVLTPTMIDKYPELKNEKPRGYDAGGSYKNCPAMFDNGAVNVCEYYFDSARNQWRRQPDPVNALKHEIGHALDAYLGRLSEQRSFITAYQADFAKLTDSDKRDLSYYCYNDTGAHSETFAELASALLGANSYSARKLANCFPHATEDIRQHIAPDAK
jgi:hypothetical protein